MAKEQASSVQGPTQPISERYLRVMIRALAKILNRLGKRAVVSRTKETRTGGFFWRGYKSDTKFHVSGLIDVDLQ